MEEQTAAEQIKGTGRGQGVRVKLPAVCGCPRGGDTATRSGTQPQCSRAGAARATSRCSLQCLTQSDFSEADVEWELGRQGGECNGRGSSVEWSVVGGRARRCPSQFAMASPAREQKSTTMGLFASAYKPAEKLKRMICCERKTLFGG
uniref:Uncharacterized protein n=1 Tax=Setaria viridis TaxID=4556 RepID=A0A4U6W0U2_SETVI|nr:hypothetical protein SEVIR_2G411700v2 [Setaria viridis]